MHPLSELDRDVADTDEVVRVGHIELVGSKCEDVGLDLDLTAMNASHHLGSFDECRGRGALVTGYRNRERRGTSLTPFDEFGTAFGRVPVEDVVHGTCGITGRPDVDRTHDEVRSPREVRTSSTAICT